MRKLAALVATVLLAACGPVVPRVQGPTAPPPAPTPTPAAANAVLTGVHAGPPVDSLAFTSGGAASALASFIESCPRVTTRTDASGLTRPEDWRAVCQAASVWPRNDARRFFAQYFESVRVSDGAAFATGYYEPEIAGVRTRRPGFDVPVYGMPNDLVRGWHDDIPASERTGRAPLAQQYAPGRYRAYFSRKEIEEGALAGKGLEIAWAADPIEFFFLQVQGSGRLRAPDGSVIRIGYAGQNGRGYTGIGSVMRERGLIGEGPGKYPGSMQGIMQYLRDHPDEGRKLMQLNESWVFFRELTGDGPLGALSVPVRARTSVAADPNFVPLGAPVWLDLDRAEADGLWIAQDTGGAIKGPNRFDTFWGAGAEARTIAGGMSGRGQALVLLPKGTLDRLKR